MSGHRGRGARPRFDDANEYSRSAVVLARPASAAASSIASVSAPPALPTPPPDAVNQYSRSAIAVATRPTIAAPALPQSADARRRPVIAATTPTPTAAEAAIHAAPPSEAHPLKRGGRGGQRGGSANRGGGGGSGRVGRGGSSNGAENSRAAVPCTDATHIGPLAASVVSAAASTATSVAAAPAPAAFVPLPLPRHTYTLIDERLEVCTADIEAAVREQSDFSVIGVCGLQSCGKSALVSRFARHAPGRVAFPTASAAAARVAAAQTRGVHVHITTERVILLDTQPLFSTALGAASLDEIDAHALQLAVFLLMACHTVVLVLDDFAEAHQLVLLMTRAAAIRARIATETPFSTTTTAAFFSLPELVVVANKVPAAEFGAPRARALEHALAAVLRCPAGVQLCTSIRNPRFEVLNSASGVSCSIFMLPQVLDGDVAERARDADVEPSDADLSRIAFASECDELVARVRVAPKRLAPGTGRVTERDWLAYCARLWHSLATSAALAEHRGTR